MRNGFFALSALHRGKNPPVMQIEEERAHILTEKSSFFLREAYKTLRTNVVFSLADVEGCKTVIVTSAVQAEGKSITAINLAISCAEMGQKVLLIDCDLRRPKLSRLLEKKPKTGLSNVLVKPELLDEALCHTEIAGLDAIFSGDVPLNPSELLGSARMKRLMEALEQRYDYIILDTPPVDMVTDACVLAPECSGVLFVVRAGMSERPSVQHAVEQLRYAKAKLLGFVLNEVEHERGVYGYRRRYGDYKYNSYGYGDMYQSHGEMPKNDENRSAEK